MLVHRDPEIEVDTRAAIARARHADALTTLIDVGVLESAIADARMPERDMIDTSGARSATLAAARAWIGSSSADAVGEALSRVVAPPRVRLSVPEGFARDAVFPETYALAARTIAKQTRRAFVIGVRNIGATLSAVVVAALETEGCAVSSCTVRPRKNGDERVLRLDEDLSDAWEREAASGATFVVVDDGPGETGESFASVVVAIRALGVSLDRIVLMPSRMVDASALRSEHGRRVWSSVAKMHVDPKTIGITPDRVFGLECMDFSAGRWREHLEAWPAVDPRHERRKAFARKERRIVKFVGLGRFGEAARSRASQLAEIGFGVRPGALRSGFLDLPWVDGRPLTRCEGAPNATRVGQYVGRVARAFPAGEARNDALVRMIRTNLVEAIGALPVAVSKALDAASQTTVRAAEIDARMLAHEWIVTQHGLVKVDTLDHHRDRFFPGAHAPEWDLAAAEMELAMNDEESAAMIRAYERAAGAPVMLDFFRVAYAAFRAGYATNARDALAGTEDGARFETAARRYVQHAMNAALAFAASSRSPRKSTPRSSMRA